MKSYRPKLAAAFEAVRSLLILVLVVMSINFAAQISRVATSTKSIVQSQASVLSAIKQVTDDTHTTAAQQTAIIICMLQVPIANRTTDLQAQCRAQSIAAPTPNNVSGTSNRPTGINVPGPSSKNTPTSASSQSDNPQPTPAPKSPSSTPTPLPSVFERILAPVKNLINGL